MKRKMLGVLCIATTMGVLLAGCGNSDTTAADQVETTQEEIQADQSELSAEMEDLSADMEDLSAEAEDLSAEAETTSELADGTYTVTFETDSSMFHVNEANDEKGTLTVKDGKMTVHVSLISQNIVNVFPGTSEEAQKDGAELIEPTVDSVTYSDGYTEDVYGFDIPVPALDEEFDVAIIGTKGKWYDHKVVVKDPVPAEE